MSTQALLTAGENEKHSMIMQALDWAYGKALTIDGQIDSSYDLAKDYLDKAKTKEEAITSLIRWQITKCATSGFLTGFGGFLTLPVTVPVNISSVLFLQLRMISAIAIIGGYDPKSDQVRTLSYVCLTGSAASELLKGVGIRVGEKITGNLIKNISGKTLLRINRMVGFRMLTKFGRTGVINLGKALPVIGAIVGGTLDGSSTMIIGRTARNVFMPSIAVEPKAEIIVNALPGKIYTGVAESK